MDIDTLIKRFPRHGLAQRPTQRQMMEAVLTTLSQKSTLCIEAPTGTGKTLSYLLAGWLALKPKQHLVISTATVALQGQLIEKDLPLLRQLTQQDLSIAIAKGRGRYVCLAKLYDQTQQTDLISESADLTRLQQQLETNQWDGDRDHLTLSIKDSEWQQLTTDANGCTGKHCQFFEECVFFKARRKQHKASIIVTNHSLLLSDLELGGGAILPEPEQCMYIIDECHHLPNQAIHHFSKSTTVMGHIDWINTLTKLINRGAQQGFFNTDLPSTLQPLTHNLVESLKALSDYLDTQSKHFSEEEWLLSPTDIQTLDPLTSTLLSAAHHLLQHVNRLDSDIKDTIDQREKQKKAPDNELNRASNGLGFILSRLSNLVETFRQLCHERAPNEAPIAKWITQHQHYQIHTAPINISKTLQQTLWQRDTLGIVLCSATVRALGSFSDFRRRTGLTENTTTELAIEPFFDYKQSILFVPSMQHAPQGTSQSDHQTEALKHIQSLILPNSGTLVLFTSRRAMEQTYADLPDALAADVLMQTHTSKQQLIKRHKDRIRAGQRSVLFGLASLGEGIDLPADFCEHVIIHKLPFSVPTTPIERTRNDWLKAHKKNPFMLSTLPDASLKLTQYVGRLVRQDTDRGIVTILDKRLYSKPYGKQLLNGLPSFAPIINQPIEAMKTAASEFYTVDTS